MRVACSLALCLLLLLLLALAAALPPPLPSRLHRHSAAVLTAVQEAQAGCTCEVPEGPTAEFYPNCLEGMHSAHRSCIPRIIHQTGKETFAPAKDRLYHLSWSYANPGWIVLLWSDGDVFEWMAENYAWFVDTFRSYENPVQRADAFRYFVLHAYGGVYADLDYEAVRPLDSYVAAISRPLAFVGPGDWHSSISNSLMMSRYCPRLWEPLHRRLNESATSSKAGFWGLWPSSRVMSSTGPTFLRVWLETQRPNFVCRLLRAQFSPCDYCSPNCKTRDGVLAVHHYAQSWNNIDTLMLNLFVCNWKYVVAFLIVLAILRTQPHARLLALAALRRCQGFWRTEILYVGIALCLTFLIVSVLPT